MAGHKKEMTLKWKCVALSSMEKVLDAPLNILSSVIGFKRWSKEIHDRDYLFLFSYGFVC